MPGADHLPGHVRRSWRSLARELGAFGVVGATAFFVDVGLFQLGYVVAGLDPVAAKLASTLIATAVAYGGHRYWSFAHRARTGLRRSALLFAAVNATTLLIGLGVVWLVHYPLGQESALVLQAANLAAIAIGTAVRFLAYRRWVFPARRDPAPAPVFLSRPAASRSGR